MVMALSLNSFNKQLQKCFGKAQPKKLLVALSGGVDSMCLTHLLAQCQRNYPQMEVFAATIDHGYRDKSDAEAKAVGSIVKNWNVQHQIRRLKYDIPPKNITNFEEVARTLRYNSFREICLEQNIDTVVVAHNLDDCIETFLQRLVMNSTLYGLVGLSTKAPMPVATKSPNEKICVIRPLLSFSKKEICEYCLNNDVNWFEDVSNADVSLTYRNKLRFMINDYVPSVVTERPEVESVSRSSLIASIETIKDVLSHYNEQKSILDRKIRTNGYFFNEKNGSLKFKIPFSTLKNCNPSVFARWLYEQGYPLSSSKHYHWSYAKFERQVMDHVESFLKGQDDTYQMNFVGIIFQMQRLDQFIDFYLSKQPPLRELRHETIYLQDNRNWILFDKTWWIRISSSRADLQLSWYTNSMKKQVTEKFPQLKEKGVSLKSKIGNVPILLDSNMEIIGLPTHGLYVDGVGGECKMKSLF